MKEEPLPERPETEIVAGLLRVKIGGRRAEDRELPILAAAASREWKKELARRMVGDVATMDLETPADLSVVGAAIGDRMLDLVVAYDLTASLGGREWLEANATDVELYGLFRRLLDVSFPFVHDLRTAIAELRALGMGDLLASLVPAGGLSPSDQSPQERSISDSVASSDSDLLVASRPS